MKQMLTAGIIALGIHGLLLCLNFNWPETLSLERPKSQCFEHDVDVITR